MSDRPAPTPRGIVPGQVAEIIVTLDGAAGRRGSGYRAGPTAVLTAAHVLDGAVSVRVRLDADRPGEWITEAISCWTDSRSDLAVLTIAPREGEPPVTMARCGRISAREAVLAVQAVGFPRFKLKTDDSDRSVYRDSHQAVGSVAVLSNRREGTLEVTVPPPEQDPDPEVSPWEGMSGAAVWVGDRIVGVIAKHHRSDGLRRLAATRLDLALEGLDANRHAELQALIGLPDVFPDVVSPSPGEWVATAYQAQVRDIAPDRLLERKEELGELVRFCAGDQPYAWWQAGPWAGKSALMAWFVLHPPAGVDVVSFFVTARLAGQSDSDACTTALIEQLTALVGESPASLLTPGARRGTMLRLLDAAASRSRESGRRLLLVIDGLDEDSGTGPSIAALLPRRPPPEVRVLVASRPHPPVPDDVAGDHPLRTIGPRQLDVSGHARDVERRAKHELRQLLAGEQLQRDVLGLMTAAGGGLTLPDLEELTGQPPYAIGGLLGGLFGRSVGSRTRPPTVGRGEERVYLFTHETLRHVAQQQFGNSLAAYHDRLHTWADTWRHRRWPPDTPQYLLRSYPRLLVSAEDLTRLVACATDQVRHDRMRDLTGGDALAVTEISTAQQLILAQHDPDLTSLVLLAVQRDDLIDRNSDIPIELPAVWARIGQPIRAEALAHSIPRPDRRVETLAQLAEVAAATGDHDRAAQLAREAEVFAGQITYPRWRLEASLRLAEGAAGGDRERATRLVGEAEILARQVSEPDSRVEALARLTGVVAAGGNYERAARLVDEVEMLAGQVSELAWVEALARLTGVVAAGGNYERTARLVNEVEMFVGQITEPDERTTLLARLAGLAAAGGNHDWAEALTGQITEPDDRVEELVRLVELAAAGGDHCRAARLAGEAEVLTGQITDPDVRVMALARLAQVVASGDDHERTARLACEAEALNAQITSPYRRMKALTWLAEAVATSGDHERATRLAREAETLTGQGSNRDHRRTETLNQLAEVVAAGGDHDRAEALIGQIPEPDRRAEALARLAEAVAASGDHERAARLAREAETLTGQGSDRYFFQANALTRLAGLAAAGGDHDWAEALAGQITDPGRGVRALALLVEVVAAGGDRERAARLVGDAEMLARQVSEPDARVEVLARLTGVVAAGGDRERAARLSGEAEVLAGQITDPGRGIRAVTLLVEVAIAGGDRERATRLVDEVEILVGQITEPDDRTDALNALVEVVATSGDYERAEALAGQIPEPDRRVETLAQLAVVAVAAGGDHERAARLVGEAETLAGQITDPDSRGWALVWLAVATAAGADLDRAEALAGQITDLDSGQITHPDSRAWMLARLANAVAAGHPDWVARLAGEAEALTGQLSYRDWQAQDSGAEALARLAGLLVGTNKGTSPVPEFGCRSSPSMRVQARRLLAAALVAGSWNHAVAGLTRVDPLAVTALADEVRARWG